MNARARNKMDEIEREERTFLKVHRPKDHRQLGAEGRETIKEKKKSRRKRKKSRSKREKRGKASQKREKKTKERKRNFSLLK